MWDYVESASSVQLSMIPPSPPSPPVDRSRPETWASPAWPACLEGGILPYYGSGQSSFSWYIRTLPSLTSAFTSFWSALGKPGPLSASFDGMIMWRSDDPPKEAGWFHLDQCPLTKPGFAMVQGLMNLLETEETTGGNVLISGSHEVFPGHYMGGRYKGRREELRGEDW